MRRMWAVAAASAVAGWAAAQTPSSTTASSAPATAASKDAVAEPGVMIFRSPGQPDRKVKLIKTTQLEDGRVVTEVKDVKTGETLYVATGTATQPIKPKVVSTLAKDVVAKPTTLAKSVGEGPVITPPAKPSMTPTIPTMPTSVAAPSANLPAVTLPATTTLKTEVAREPQTNIKPTTTSKSPAAVAAIAPVTPPTAVKEPGRLSKAFSKPSSAKTETLVPAKSTVVTPSAMPVVAPMPAPTLAPAPIPAPMPANAVGVAGEPLKVSLPVGVVPVEFRMKNELAADAATLRSAMRPTQRQDAATALAEGRYGSSSEVKVILAGCAKSDPAPIVRAHCIDCLSKLGYAEADHVAYLRQCLMDSDDTVKTAAANALVKLQPKK